MSLRINTVILGGNLCADPEYREVKDTSVTTLRLAVNHANDKVSFINAEVWGSQGETCRQHLEKGSGVIVQGQLIVDSYTDKDGNKRTKPFIRSYKVDFVSRPQRTADVTHTSASTSDYETEDNMSF